MHRFTNFLCGQKKFYRKIQCDLISLFRLRYGLYGLQVSWEWLSTLQFEYFINDTHVYVVRSGDRHNRQIWNRQEEAIHSILKLKNTNAMGPTVPLYCALFQISSGAIQISGKPNWSNYISVCDYSSFA